MRRRTETRQVRHQVHQKVLSALPRLVPRGDVDGALEEVHFLVSGCGTGEFSAERLLRTFRGV